MAKKTKTLKISLAAARVNANMTQEQAAKSMHVSKSTIVSWEKGVTCPDISQAMRLSDLYAIPMDSIFFAKTSR